MSWGKAVGEALGLGKEILEKVPDSTPERAERKEVFRFRKTWWRLRAFAGAPRVGKRRRVRLAGLLDAVEDRLERLGVDIKELEDEYHDASSS